MRMVVVLPEPLGPRKPTISPRRTGIDDVVDDGAVAEALDQVLDVDGGAGAHAARLTSTICPGLQGGRRRAGRASTQVDELLRGSRASR